MKFFVVILTLAGVSIAAPFVDDAPHTARQLPTKNGEPIPPFEGNDLDTFMEFVDIF